MSSRPPGGAWSRVGRSAVRRRRSSRRWRVLYLGRSLTFWHDEWRSITFDGGWSDFLRPVNEHWSTFPLLAYRATFHIVGLDSYLPYLAQVIVLHAIAVAGAYVLVRRRIGRMAATLFAIPLLLLGSGAENLFWAFQTGFVGSVAFGVWGLVAIEQRGKWPPIAASALLLASLMSSGIGLVFVVAASVRTLLDPPIRRRALAVVPPLAAYLVWYAWAGHAPVDDPGHIAPPFEIGRFVARGVAHSTAAVTGINDLPWGETFAGVGFLVALIALGWAAIVHRPRPLATASVLAIVSLYVLAGSVRAQLDFDYALISRYVYIAGFLLALALADALEPLHDRIGPGRTRHVLWAAFLGFGCVFVTLANAGPLRAAGTTSSTRPTARAPSSRSRRSTTASRWVDPQSGYGVMPPVPLLVTTVEAHGSPTHDRFFPGVARTPPPAAYEEALLVLIGARFRVEPASAPSSAPVAMEVREVVDAKIVRRDDCFMITAAGPLPSATFLGPDGTSFPRVGPPQRADHGGPWPRATARRAYHRRLDGSARRSTSSSRTSGPVTSARLRFEPAGSSSPVTICPLSGARG